MNLMQTRTVIQSRQAKNLIQTQIVIQSRRRRISYKPKQSFRTDRRRISYTPPKNWKYIYTFNKNIKYNTNTMETLKILYQNFISLKKYFWTHCLMTIGWIVFFASLVIGLISCFYSFAKLCLTLWDPMNYSTPGFPDLHYGPGVCLNSCSLSRWCFPTISSSVAFFSCLQSFPASGSFLVSRLFASGSQSIGASASVLPINIQGWFLLGLTGLISLVFLS